MQDTVKYSTMGELPVQLPSSPSSDAEQRARFFNSGNAFMVKLSDVPDAAFVDEPAKALDPATPTGLIMCDSSKALNTSFPATSPLVLAHYGRVRNGETLHCEFEASGIIYYVIQGSGTTDCDGEVINWGAGDVFVAPGGTTQKHTATEGDAVLWIVTNEPQVAFDQLQPPAKGSAPTPLVHYPAAEIENQLDTIYGIGHDAQTAGAAIIFSSDMQEGGRNILPTLTLGMNTLMPGVTQRPHRHNSVAVSLVIKGEGCFSTIDGNDKPWSPWCTTITPPTSAHSHTNNGSERAMFLIVQDGGLYYHARANGFEFVEE